MQTCQPFSHYFQCLNWDIVTVSHHTTARKWEMIRHILIARDQMLLICDFCCFSHGYNCKSGRSETDRNSQRGPAVILKCLPCNPLQTCWRSDLNEAEKGKLLPFISLWRHVLRGKNTAVKEGNLATPLFTFKEQMFECCRDEHQHRIHFYSDTIRISVLQRTYYFYTALNTGIFTGYNRR